MLRTNRPILALTLDILYFKCISDSVYYLFMLIYLLTYISAIKVLQTSFTLKTS
ncbi:protein of unknown function [Citrobacter freundii]|nr:protein of unknown function [Citrobacter freundii]